MIIIMKMCNNNNNMLNIHLIWNYFIITKKDSSVATIIVLFSIIFHAMVNNQVFQRYRGWFCCKRATEHMLVQKPKKKMNSQTAGIWYLWSTLLHFQSHMEFLLSFPSGFVMPVNKVNQRGSINQISKYLVYYWDIRDSV